MWEGCNDIPFSYYVSRDIVSSRAGNATTTYGGVVYHATVVDVVGLMEATDQVNHGMRY